MKIKISFLLFIDLLENCSRVAVLHFITPNPRISKTYPIIGTGSQNHQQIVTITNPNVLEPKNNAVVKSCSLKLTWVRLFSSMFFLIAKSL